MRREYEISLKAIEGARRHGVYAEMEALIASLDEVIGCLSDAERYEIEARKYYEMHMAAYDVSACALDMKEKNKQLGFAFYYGNESARASDRAGDPVGRLFIQMNVAGLLLPALGIPFNVCRVMSEQTREEAEIIENRLTESFERRLRAARVAANSYHHCGGLLVDQGGDPNEVGLLLKKLEENLLYRIHGPYRDEIDWKVNEMRAYAASHAA